MKNKIDFTTKLFLPQSLRPALREPLGPVFPSVHDWKKTHTLIPPPLYISVGDIVSTSLKQEHKLLPRIEIIDYRTRRTNLPRPDSTPYPTVQNPPATITPEAVHQLKKMIKSILHKNTSQTLIIDGEEDLLALPAIILAPVQSIVFYGLPDRGIVAISINNRIKNEVKMLLSQFSTIPKSS